MSNARSPREVCSTTMGTRGLIARAVYKSALTGPNRERRLSGSAIGVRSPQTGLGALALPPLLLGGPEPLPGGSLVLRDRLGRAGDQLGGLAQPELLAKQRVAPVGAAALAQPLRALTFLSRPQRPEHLVI